MSADLTEWGNQLRSTLGQMEIALGAITDAIVWADAEGRGQWCNAAFYRLVNRSHILLLNAKLDEILPLTQVGKPMHLPTIPISAH
jgi:two-component system, sensor histidine kinase and response regulator